MEFWADSSAADSCHNHNKQYRGIRCQKAFFPYLLPTCSDFFISFIIKAVPGIFMAAIFIDVPAGKTVRIFGLFHKILCTPCFLIKSHAIQINGRVQQTDLIIFFKVGFLQGKAAVKVLRSVIDQNGFYI